MTDARESGSTAGASDALRQAYMRGQIDRAIDIGSPLVRPSHRYVIMARDPDGDVFPMGSAGDLERATREWERITAETAKSDEVHNPGSVVAVPGHLETRSGGHTRIGIYDRRGRFIPPLHLPPAGQARNA